MAVWKTARLKATSRSPQAIVVRAADFVEPGEFPMSTGLARTGDT